MQVPHNNSYHHLTLRLFPKLRELFPIRLSVVCHRHLLQKYEFLRHHIIRDELQQLLLQPCHLLTFCLWKLPLHYVGCQALHLIIAQIWQYNRMLNSRNPPDIIFNVLELDPVSMQLDLQIDPSTVKKQTVLQIALIAGMVATDHARTFRLLKKRLFCQLLLPIIAGAHRVT